MSRTCLIADADPFIAHLLRRFAEESGMQSIQAQSGQDVLELAQALLPAVIILEPELPGKLRGWDVIRSLREDPRTCQIPVITCSWQPGAEITAQLGQVQGNLQKPELHYGDFVEAIRRLGLEPENRPGGSG